MGAPDCRYDQENCIKNKKKYYAISLLLVWGGAFGASVDAFNLEFLNPAMIGATFLSLIIPAAALTLQNKMQLRRTIMISLALSYPQ